MKTYRRFKEALIRFKQGRNIHAFQAKVTIHIAANAISKEAFLTELQESNAIELAVQTLERNGYIVADRGGYEPIVEARPF